MLETIVSIILAVTIFGILLFLLVKKLLKNRLEHYFSKNTKTHLKKNTD